MTSGHFPTIEPVVWLPASDVLGGEASHFTPWLQQPKSLEMLGVALELEDLTAVSAEHNVLGKRLDILASALDENGEVVPVCIENQYGTSDADHLGRLIAYLAQQERGRAIWIVEHAHEAFVAGVRFLNRTSTDDVGYYLVQVRFTHGEGTSYQVHFEVLAAPLAWERGGKGPTGARPVNVAKVEYLNAVHDAVRSGLLDAGFPSTGTQARGAYIWIQWPKSLWIREFSYRLHIKTTRHDATVALFMNRLDSKAANAEAARVVRDRFGDTLDAAVPSQSVVDWDVVGPGLRKPILINLPGGGYVGGDAEATAAWALATCQAVLDVVERHPMVDLAELVRARVADIEEVDAGLDEEVDED